ncbi:MAG: MraY family glycosyltransferase [Candidatus Omnitrophica bacterium]|nr:MraY family glycosyltransferase [Candidatus Omnitrophota bacterium]
MNNVTAYLLIMSVAGIVAYAGTAVVRVLAQKMSWLDKPAGRKVHTRAIPTMGGIAIWLGFTAGMITAFMIFPELRHVFLLPFIGIGIAAFMIVLTGIYDDRHDLNASIKLIIQMTAALIVITAGFEISIITGLFGGGLPVGVLSVFITVLWIVGMINAINLLDGLDGLAAGVSGIAVFFMCIAAFKMQNGPVVFLSLCLFGALLGFLPHNFFPAKIFMGNTGSMFLGLLLSIIALAGFQKRTAVFTLFVPLMAVAVPLIDTLLSIIRRLLTGKPIFSADKEHIHHKLLQAEKTQVRAVLSLYFLTFCFGLIALSFSSLRGIYAILALLIVALVTWKWLKDWGFLDFK